MNNHLIYCPYCGKKTPEQNYCINCGKPINDITIKPNSSSNSEELIITEIIVSEQGKRLADPKTLYFTKNYILKDKCSRSSFGGKNMDMGNIVKIECENELNEPVNINEIPRKYPEMEILPIDEIEKAELSNNFWNTFLEITTPSTKSKYVLAAKKYKKNYLELFNRILKPEIGNRFQVK
ncbi:MAG: hypothetical protein QME14_00515 [Methanobacteriaceae archaeon]|nr:hypothetical protein [Methanobacteriaceae archaeon]